MQPEAQMEVPASETTQSTLAASDDLAISPPNNGPASAPSQSNESLFGATPQSNLDGSSSEFFPNAGVYDPFQTASMDPVFWPVFPDPMVPATSLAGPAGPCQVNLQVRPEQTFNDMYNVFALHSRMDRLDGTLSQIQVDLSRLTRRVEHCEQSGSHESHVNDSIEKIKKGLDRFFTHYASHLDGNEGVGRTLIDDGT